MPTFISPMVFRPETVREGRGFSIAEIEAAGLNAGEADVLGVPVDIRRKSSHEENVEILKDFAKQAKESGVKVPKSKQSSKGQRGRAQRAVTKAGHTMRGI